MTSTTGSYVVRNDTDRFHPNFVTDQTLYGNPLPQVWETKH